MRWTEELTEFEFAARTEPVGDAEAYGHSLGEPEIDLDGIDEDLEDLEKDLEALEEQLLSGSDDDDDDDEEEEMRRKTGSAIWHAAYHSTTGPP
jgi:hypothetical protein